MAGKIPVTVVTGFLGSGKTTLLNRLLSGLRDAGGPQAIGRVMILINELGNIGLDHERIVQLDDHLVLLESGCLCCAVRGDLVNALRQLFLDALHKKIPPFSSLLIETTGIADPAPVMYTLQYERFLADRYAYAGCITVVDGEHGLGQLRRHPEVLRQVVLADVLAISKADMLAQEQVSALHQALARLNPAAPLLITQSLPGLHDLLALAADRSWQGHARGRATMWSGRAMGRERAPHAGIGVLTVAWAQAWSRVECMRALSGLLADMGQNILRVKGRVELQGEAQASAVHAVHQHLYPLEAVAAAKAGARRASARRNDPSGDCDAGSPHEWAAVLLFIYRDLEADALLERIKILFPGEVRVLSSDGNFIQ